MTRVTKMARKRHEEASGFNVTPLLPKSKAQSEPRAETQQSSEANIAEKRKQEEPLAVAPTKKAKKNKAGRKKDEDAEPSATTKDAASDPQKVESGKKQEGIHKAEKSDNVVPEKVESEVDSAMTAKEKRKGKNKNKTVQSNSADGEVDNDAQPSNEIPVHAKNGKKRKAEKDQGLMEDGDAMAVDAAGEGSGTGPTADSAGEPQKKKKKMRHRSKTDETETSGKDTKTSNSAQKPLSKYEREALRRRTRREKLKEKNMVCFLCRNAGHSIKFCPKATEAEKKVPVKSEDSVAVSGICYKCGSTEHTSSQCRKIVDPKNPYPFAHCFVCNQQGHLASLCPKNERGLYPNGGGCKYCGSVRHFARDCKPALQEAGVTTLGKIDLRQGADDDDVFVALHKMQADNEIQPSAPMPTAGGLVKKSKKKVVKF